MSGEGKNSGAAATTRTERVHADQTSTLNQPPLPYDRETLVHHTYQTSQHVHTDAKATVLGSNLNCPHCYEVQKENREREVQTLLRTFNNKYQSSGPAVGNTSYENHTW